LTEPQRIGALKTHLAQVQLFDECFNYAHRIIATDVIIDTFGQQHDLISVCAFNESFHGMNLVPCVASFYFKQVFLHRLDHEPSLTLLDWLPLSRRSSVAVDLSACEE
jgi:hypothetical protein